MNNNPKEKVVAFVPIKFNSQRLENKNFLEFNGKPLCFWIFEKIKQIRGIDEIYVYCSNVNIVKYIPDNIIYKSRPCELDSDTTRGIDIYQSFAKEVNADIYLLVHCTSPLISITSISNGLEAVMSRNYDSSYSVVKHQTFAWYQNKPINYDLETVLPTQQMEPIYLETSAFYIFRKDILDLNRRIGFNPKIIELSKIESIDIDTYDDYLLAKIYIEMTKFDKNKILSEKDIILTEKIRNIKLIAFDFDGTISDGMINIDSDSNYVKNYYTQDGEMIDYISKHSEYNFIVGIISGNDLNFFKKKSKEWKLDFLKGNCKDKLKYLKKYLEQHNLSLENVAYMGDGLNDIEISKSVGLSASPANGNRKLLQIVDFISKFDGGKGAVKDFIELILERKNFITNIYC